LSNVKNKTILVSTYQTQNSIVSSNVAK